MMKGVLSAAGECFLRAGDHDMFCSGLTFWAMSHGAAVGVRVLAWGLGP